LTPAAADALYNDPDGFERTYGDQVVIGHQKQHYVYVKVSFARASKTAAQDHGMSLDASGQWGTGSASISGDVSSFLNTCVQTSSANVEVVSTVGDVPGLANAALSNSGDVTNLLAALATASSIVGASAVDSHGGAKVVGFTVAPISYLVPAVPTVVTKVGSSLYDYMAAYVKQKRGWRTWRASTKGSSATTPGSTTPRIRGAGTS